MKIRNKNPELKKLIEDFSRKGGSGALKAMAQKLNRPRSRRYEVDVAKLEKLAKPGESIVVPGSVLGSSELTKPLSVYAVKFSSSARERIEKAGGKCKDICELDEKSAPKARIVG